MQRNMVCALWLLTPPGPDHSLTRPATTFTIVSFSTISNLLTTLGLIESQFQGARKPVFAIGSSLYQNGKQAVLAAGQCESFA